MYRAETTTHERPCDCACRIHHGQSRTSYDNPQCHCLITCASQPMTLLAPQIGAALFLDRQGALWIVPGLEPGHWDWRCATPIHVTHPYVDAADQITGLIHETTTTLIPLIHRT